MRKFMLVKYFTEFYILKCFTEWYHISEKEAKFTLFTHVKNRELIDQPRKGAQFRSSLCC